MELFDGFPYLTGEKAILRQMTESDLDALAAITGNDEVYRYILPFLYKKNRGNLLAAVRNFAGRDFEKKKMIITGIYLKEDAGQLVGLFEIFGYKAIKKEVTIGYRLHPGYWHRGIASECVAIGCDYLINKCNINRIYAYVMPENIYSEKVLLKNGFVKQPEQKQDKNWGGKDVVMLDVFIRERGHDAR